MPVDATNIQNFIDRVSKAPDMRAIWLIGSRTNGTANLDSDWDFIAFGTEATINFLSEAKILHEVNVDFLVVSDGDNFRAAWGQLDKIGSLKEWEWTEKSETEATYLATKPHQSGDGVFLSQADARKVWPVKIS